MPRIHFIVAPREHDEWLEACLGAVFAQAGDDAPVTLIDRNDAARGAAERLARRHAKLKRLPVPNGMGVAAATNRAAAQARDAQFIMLLDAEAVLALDALQRLAAAFAARPMAAVIGCKVLGGDVETINHIGLRMRGNGLPTPIGKGEVDRGQYRGFQEALTLQIGAMLIRQEVWTELGGLDERFEHGFYDRIDFCLRCWRANWRIAVTGDATATHFGLGEEGTFAPEEAEPFFFSRARFLQKHYGLGGWLTRWLPDEIAWWQGRGSETVPARGRRLLALRTLARALRTRPPAPPPVNMRGGPWG